jgi:hypothetical protein
LTLNSKFKRDESISIMLIDLEYLFKMTHLVNKQIVGFIKLITRCHKSLELDESKNEFVSKFCDLCHFLIRTKKVKKSLNAISIEENDIDTKIYQSKSTQTKNFFIEKTYKSNNYLPENYATIPKMMAESGNDKFETQMYLNINEKVSFEYRIYTSKVLFNLALNSNGRLRPAQTGPC